MGNIIIGRPINGISLNPELEFLLNDEGTVRCFEGTNAAVAFLKGNGFNDEDIPVFTFMESCGVCRRCGAPLFKSLLPEYAYQCFGCDEDFYAFEQEVSEDQQISDSGSVRFVFE